MADEQTTTIIELIPMTQDQALRIAAGTPGPEDFWAEGFPREDDAVPAATFAGLSEDSGPFGSYVLVPRAHGRLIGTAGFYGPPDEAGEVTIGYGMVESEWGQGYGTRAVAKLVEVSRLHGGVTVINADTELDNIGSQRVLEKNGFEHVRTTDELRYYVLRLK